MKALTLKAHRESVLRLRQKEIAKRARCPQSQISKMEKRGHMPRSWELERYAGAYEVTVKELVRMIEWTREDWDLPLLKTITVEPIIVSISDAKPAELPAPMQKAGLA